MSIYFADDFEHITGQDRDKVQAEFDKDVEAAEKLVTKVVDPPAKKQARKHTQAESA